MAVERVEQSNKTTRFFFDVVPIDILYLISDYLPTEDLHTVENVGTAWSSLLAQDKFWMRRYGTSRDTAIEICKRFQADENFKDGHVDLIKVLAVDMIVTWLNGNYLCKENDANLGHEVVRLDRVCFLHMITTVENVVPGIYNVWWRMKAVNPDVYGNTSINVKDGENAIIGELRLTAAHFRDAADMFGSEWFYFRIENIKVSHLERVSFTFQCEDGYIWKSGLYWDSVEMTRAAHPDRLKDVYNPLERDDFISRTTAQDFTECYDDDHDVMSYSDQEEDDDDYSDEVLDETADSS